MYVVVGAHSRDLSSNSAVAMKAKSTFRHPNYDPNNLQYDFALIKLEQPVRYTDKVCK